MPAAQPAVETSDRRLVTTAELAAYLGVSEKTISDWRYRGIGPPSFRVGKHTRYRLADVDQWLETQRIPPART